jgi:hypothetical protein
MGKALDIAGLWNGGDLHMIVGPKGIRGTALKQISDQERGYQSCRYQIMKLPQRPAYSGLADCLGTSPLRFELSEAAPSDLTDEENAILLVAYLAAPPAVWNP